MLVCAIACTCSVYLCVYNSVHIISIREFCPLLHTFKNLGYASLIFWWHLIFNVKWEDINEVVCELQKSKRKVIFNYAYFFNVCLLVI